MGAEDPRNINIQDFDYPLPDEQIARHPLAERDQCKLLVRSASGLLSQHTFAQLPSLLPKDSLLVYNNTRVINARLRFNKGANNDGASIEIFCLEPQSPRDYEQNFASQSGCSWLCFVGNSKRWKAGSLSLNLRVNGLPVELTATRLDRQGNASIIAFNWNNTDTTFSQIISAAGEIPIPPYLNRPTEGSDKTDYQTVYSRIEGSVAAPTAGLHFTQAVLDGLSSQGILRRELTLHVGAGTFQPVKTDSIGEHIMHSEFIAVDKALIAELATTDRKIIAVGTTSVRTLESLFFIGCRIIKGLPIDELPQWWCYENPCDNISVSESFRAIVDYLDHKNQSVLLAQTRIIISPSYRYRVVKGIITNFHQPKSTLLLLVSAFIGDDWKNVYRYALDNKFRFLSYGDACLFLS